MDVSSSLVSELMAQFHGAPLQQLAQKIGTDTAQTQDAVSAALPMMQGRWAKEAQQQGGLRDSLKMSGSLFGGRR